MFGFLFEKSSQISIENIKFIWLLSINRSLTQVNQKKNQLDSHRKHLSFSLLISNKLTTNLSFIDLSGCVGLSADCISSLISSSNYLTNENLFLCDNIQMNTSLSSVNCCRNLENNSGRFCCRGNR